MEEVENSSSTVISCNNNKKKSKYSGCNKEDHGDGGGDDDAPALLPGFRFHPTEEELVAFYLKRKVEKKGNLSVDIIKHVDIYKYDPWDLPMSNNVGGEKEWYFFCQRGRKYRNSVRPNRVTGSGFWKATGIDRPVYAGDGDGVIGLKKSLVYYRGSAGKGTKTDWMMHEFRLPPAETHDAVAVTGAGAGAGHSNAKTAVSQEAEIWTLCRIVKRSVSYRKCISPEWPRPSGSIGSKRATAVDPTPKTQITRSLISFTNTTQMHPMQKPYSPQTLITTNPHYHHIPRPAGHNLMTMASPRSSSSSVISLQGPSVAATAATSSLSGSVSGDINEVLRQDGNWEDLRSIVDCTTAIRASVDNRGIGPGLHHHHHHHHPFCMYSECKDGVL